MDQLAGGGLTSPCVTPYLLQYFLCYNQELYEASISKWVIPSYASHLLTTLHLLLSTYQPREGDE